MITLGHEVLFACLFVFLAVQKSWLKLESVTIESALNVMKYCITFLIHIKIKNKTIYSGNLQASPRTPQWCLCCVWGHICALTK